MIIKSRIEGMADWLFIEDIPDIYRSDYSLVEKDVAIKRNPVLLDNHQLTTGGLFVMRSEMRFDEPRNVYTELEGEAITSQFIFYKKASEELRGKPNALYGRSRHNIRYSPGTSSEHEVKGGLDYMYFLIVMSKDYYFNLIDRHSLIHEDFVREIEQGQYTSFADEDFFVTLEMRRVIDEMVNCRQQGEFKRIHTEARILELLMYQLEQLGSKERMPELIRGDDILKLEEARELLKRNYVNPPTQRDLSREVALNEFKLRRGFKEYFGITVYDYVTRLRMEQARRLLLEDRRSIAEVSAAVGFSHQNNFSIAFKKYFGIPPSELKN